jgi:hypothetical protein
LSLSDDGLMPAVGDRDVAERLRAHLNAATTGDRDMMLRQIDALHAARQVAMAVCLRHSAVMDCVVWPHVPSEQTCCMPRGALLITSAAPCCPAGDRTLAS